MTTMLVETFEVTEVDAEGAIECESEALELIAKLGLEGQQKLLTKSEDGDSVRCPYRKMTLEERLTYQVVCPSKAKLKEFSDSAIPVRVLQVAAHAVDLFQEVEVWSATSADIKDPVLIGKNKTGYTYEFFMLARWGEVLEPFEKLFTLAVKHARKTRQQKLTTLAIECKAKSEAAETMADLDVLKQDLDPHLSDYAR